MVADYYGSPRRRSCHAACLARQLEQCGGSRLRCPGAFRVLEFIVLERNGGDHSTQEVSLDLRAFRTGQSLLVRPGRGGPCRMRRRFGIPAARGGYRSSLASAWSLGQAASRQLCGTSLRCAPPIDAAFFRMFTKAFCRQRDLRPPRSCRFSARTFRGCGGHINLSLRGRKNRRPTSLPIQARSARAQSDRPPLSSRASSRWYPRPSLMCGHTVNAYRRLAPGSWAPRTVSWAPSNYRRRGPGRCLETRPGWTPLELRLPGNDTNIYLALAMMLGARHGWASAQSRS